jgi:hypothetical protein
MNDYRDDETEPMTRLLGVVVREPREGEPQKRLIDLHDRKPAELTRLEISPRPRHVSTEPATQIITPDLMRPMLSLSTSTLPGPVPRPRADDRPTPAAPQPFAGSDRESPAMPIKPVFAPRLSQANQNEITASRKTPQRAMPILLGIAVLMFIATGASLLRDRARAAKRAAQSAQSAQLEAAQPVKAAATVPATPLAATAAATQPSQPEPEPEPAPAPVVVQAPAAVAAQAPAAPHAAPAPEPSPAPAPAASAPAKVGGSAPLDAATFADLEKRAVDRLRDNDHEAALALYTELARVAPKNPAFAVMVSLLTRRVRACQGDPSCAQ